MTKPFEDQLKAIREMLVNPSKEVVSEGYDLLFKLWLENMESPNFQQDLVLLAVETPELLKEFEHQINTLVIREKITDIYLRVRLKKLTSKVQKLRIDRSKETKILKKPKQIHSNTTQEPVEKDVSQKVEASAKKIFISYSHKDESFKDELIVMLSGLQRRGIIDPWQDRRIEPGTVWFDAISAAMTECNVAVLLISPDFIASPFIQNKELTRLFQRRMEEDLRVIPIIVRPCLWQEEPIIKDLQVVPKDGKPVISFSKENGDRDQVWAEIGNVLRNLSL